MFKLQDHSFRDKEDGKGCNYKRIAPGLNKDGKGCNCKGTAQVAEKDSKGYNYNIIKLRFKENRKKLQLQTHSSRKEKGGRCYIYKNID